MIVVDTSAIVAMAFGRGSGNPAALNFGDVFSFGLAKVRGLPLLYKGVAYTQTDVVSAVSSMPASAIPAGRS